VYEAKFILTTDIVNQFMISMESNCFAATVDYLELPEGIREYMEEDISFSIVESLLVTDKVVTYEIGIYIDNEFVIQVFLKTEISLKTQNSILCLSLLFVV
jgi:hypothetical protein